MVSDVGKLDRRVSRLLSVTPLLVVLIADLFVVIPASPALLRYVSSILLVCVLPGAVLPSVGAIRRRGLPPWELTLWVVALSLAAVTLLGLVLDLLPSGLTKGVWLVALNSFALPGLVLFALRGRSCVTRSAVDGRLAVRVFALVVATALVAGALVVRKRNAETAARSQPFVALWALPDPTGVVLGVRSATPSRTAYRLVVSRQPGRTTVFDFTLAYGEEWNRHLIIRSAGTSPGVVAQASLFREGRSTALRSVRVRVGPPKKRRGS